jgi:uncharacterized protein (TIGR02391 family)
MAARGTPPPPGRAAHWTTAEGIAAASRRRPARRTHQAQHHLRHVHHEDPRCLEDEALELLVGREALDTDQRRADDLRAELKRRNVHADVLHFCRAELLQQSYFHAVLEASKSIADKLRSKTGKDGDGSALVDATCSLNSGPLIAFNNLTTEWERSEQTGIAMLTSHGMVSTRRPPAASPSR